jgi:DNA repair protein RecO (recombination protein O)
LQPAFVLHTRPYRNTSLIADAITPGFGIVAVVARGARRRQSRLRGLIQPFRPLQISWYGRGDLMTLTAAEDDGPPFWYKGHALASAFYMNELLLRLLHRYDAHPELFYRYREALYQLAHTNDHAAGDAGVALQRLLRLFEKYLLQALGFGLILDREAGGGARIRPEMAYHYYREQGPVAAGRGIPPQAVAVSGRTLIALAEDQLHDSAVLREAKSLMRHLLEAHLGAKPLGSRALMEVYTAGERAAAAVAALSHPSTDRTVRSDSAVS